MDFVFEGRRKSGNSTGPIAEPDFSAVRVSTYKDEDSLSRNVIRLRFTFTSKAVLLARWIKDDRLEVGGDGKNMLLAFKRSPSGYRIVGKGFTDSVKKPAKDRPSIQVTVNADSPVAVISSLVMGEWIPLKESGVLLIASINANKNEK